MENDLKKIEGLRIESAFAYGIKKRMNNLSLRMGRPMAEIYKPSNETKFLYEYSISVSNSDWIISIDDTTITNNSENNDKKIALYDIKGRKIEKVKFNKNNEVKLLLENNCKISISNKTSEESLKEESLWNFMTPTNVYELKSDGYINQKNHPEFLKHIVFNPED